MDSIARIAATANPPSYQEATRRPDWVELIAPYVPVREYARLCLVNRRCYRHLAPRLWNDPLATASAGGPASRDIAAVADLEWFYRFMEHMQYVRHTTRLLVTCLDLRGVEAGTSELSLYSLNRSLSAYLRAVRVTFPHLRCILLSRHWDVEADDLVVADAPHAVNNADGPLMLSIPECQVKVPTVFFSSPYLHRLVYLDMSSMDGSLRKPLEQRRFAPEWYPDLRILKVGAREMGDSTATLLMRRFKRQLWSLDLSQNELTDAALDALQSSAFPVGSLRNESHFDVEGKLEIVTDLGIPHWGWIRESQWSATFGHPDRYLVDAPDYTRHVEETAQEGARTRLDGLTKIQDVSEDEIKSVLSGIIGAPSLGREYLQALDVCQSHNGITHLYLNGNKITASGLVMLIMASPGQLQHLECDTMVHDVHQAAKPEWLSSSIRVAGLLGAAHVFRPVLSSNLQVLRIHHSLVTQLLSLNRIDDGDNGWGLSTMENLWLAETFLLPRAEMAYPQAFVPDMNPRLRVLILSHIPRWSTGPLIDKLINLLKLASMQERAIQDMNRTLRKSRRRPSTVSGLRHIRLEFDYDCRDEMMLKDSVDDDKEEEVSEESAAKNFSFFDESRFSDFSFHSSVPPANAEISSSNTNTATNKNTDTTPLTSEADLAAADHRAVLDNSRNQSVSRGSQNERHTSSSSSTLLHLPRTGDTSELTLNGVNEDESARLTTGPQQQQRQQTDSPNCTTAAVANSCTGNWNGMEYTVSIWTGPPPPPPPIYSTEDTPQHEHQQQQQQEISPAVKAYMQNILDKRLCSDPQPTSPCHVLSGVPEGEFVWGAAWQAIVTRGNSNGVRKPKTRELLNGMRDVIEEIKAFRRETRAKYEAALKMARKKGEEVKLGEPHFHYRGLLQVVSEHWKG